MAARNLSSVNEKTRQQMRETPGLVDALVRYIKGSLGGNSPEDKVGMPHVKQDSSSDAVVAAAALCCVKPEQES